MSEVRKCILCGAAIEAQDTNACDTCWLSIDSGELKQTGDKIDLMGMAEERDHYKALAEYWKKRCEAAEKVTNALLIPSAKSEMGLPEFQKLIDEWQEIKDAEPK